MILQTGRILALVVAAGLIAGCGKSKTNKTTGKSPDKTVPPTGKTESKTSEVKSKTGEKSTGGPILRTPDKTEPKTAEKTPEKTAEKTPVKTPVKTPEKTPAKTPEKTPAKTPAGASVKPAGAVVTGDWPLWGGAPGRNMANRTTGISLAFEPAQKAEDGKNLLYVAPLGSQTYGNAVVAGGKVFVGTNNGGNYRPKHKGDRGVVLCFEEKTGKFLWQLTREKLLADRVNDWPEQGICSTCIVEGDRLYVVTNRAEIMCVDVNGFYDDENDGAVKDEVDKEKQDADIVWSLDMIEELGVFPHNLATSSPVIYKDWVYVVTSNGVDEAHKEIPAPRAACFLCIDKKTGKVVWEDNTPFDRILHGQWSSPAVGVVNGKAQIYMPGGDGWLYAFSPEGDGKGGGKLIWKFDLNPKESKWELGGRGTRNAIISTPVFYDNSVILAVGQDPEHNEGVGHIYRIDATKTGDISPTLHVGKDGKPVEPRSNGVNAAAGEKVIPNPNSGQKWHFGGIDTDGKLTGEEGRYIFRRTISTVAVHDGLVYAADLSGFIHCLDLDKGTRFWEHDMLSACWGSTLYVDGKILVGNEDGDLIVLAAGKEKKVLGVKTFPSSIYSTPTIANGRIYITDRSRLFCFDAFGKAARSTTE